MTGDAVRLRVTGLTKRYRAVVAVDDVSFDLERGKLLGILGPNGAGKSTLVRMMTGQTVPDGGTILVDGHRIDQEPLTARRLTGYVPQRLSLYPFLTGREVLSFVARAHGMADGAATERSAELLKRFGLQGDQDRLSREYSEGMARKLAIACALIADPALLVLDESLAGLDPRAAAEVKFVVRECLDRGTSVVLVSHGLAVLERLCDRVMVVHRGRVVRTLDRSELDGLTEAGSDLEQVFLRETGDDARSPAGSPGR